MAKNKSSAKRRTTQVTWLGHSAFRIISPKGKVMLIDPWLDNPEAPHGAKEVSSVDIILVTHGHGDHLGNTVDIGHRTNARIVAIHEVALFLQSQGLSRIEGMNKSGSVVIDGITITMTHAEHSSGIEHGGTLQIGGDPAGYVIRLENDFTVYHAGDTGVFGDMRLIRELYAPDLAIIPIGGYYTMGPVEAAKACELLRPRYIVGMHYGTYPILAGTPQELRKHLPAPMRNRVKILEPGVPVAF